MADDETDSARILSFAQQVGNTDTPAEETARRRGWIDAEGNVTDDGRDVLKSLGEQGGTRSVFR